MGHLTRANQSFALAKKAPTQIIPIFLFRIGCLTLAIDSVLSVVRHYFAAVPVSV